MIEILIVVAILGILAAIAIPQYSRFRRDALDAAARGAYHAVAQAQEAFFIAKGDYTEDYTELIQEGGLVIDPNVFYGHITITRGSDPPFINFSLNHKSDGTKTFTYDTGSSIILSEGGPRVVANDPSVP